MTFDEFKELALNPPIYKDGSIYRVEVYIYDEGECIDDSDYYDLYKVNISFYASFGDVQSALTKIYKTLCKDGLKICCSLIYEIPTGIDMRRFERYTRVLSYDADCKLIDHTLCSYPCRMKYETFRGRAKDMIRFQPGDIVEVLSLWEEGNPSLETAIITKTPRTIEESWGIYEQLGDSFVGGYESDEYSYLIGDHWLPGCNSSAAPFLIFKPHVPVTEKRKKELLGFYDNFTGRAFYREGGSRLDEIAQSTAGLSADIYPGYKNLTPSDFDPIYNASEVIHISENAGFDVENPLESILNRIEERTNGALSGFSNFIICISNTNWHGKQLNPKRISEWKKKIEDSLPYPRNVIWGERIMNGAMYYRIDIVAYK